MKIPHLRNSTSATTKIEEHIPYHSKVFGNPQKYVRRRVGERTATPCIAPTVKRGGGSVMVSGAFGNCRIGDLLYVVKLNQSILPLPAIPSRTRLAK